MSRETFNQADLPPPAEESAPRNRPPDQTGRSPLEPLNQLLEQAKATPSQGGFGPQVPLESMLDATEDLPIEPNNRILTVPDVDNPSNLPERDVHRARQILRDTCLRLEGKDRVSSARVFRTNREVYLTYVLTPIIQNRPGMVSPRPWQETLNIDDPSRIERTAV